MIIKFFLEKGNCSSLSFRSILLFRHNWESTKRDITLDHTMYCSGGVGLVKNPYKMIGINSVYKYIIENMGQYIPFKNTNNIWWPNYGFQEFNLDPKKLRILNVDLFRLVKKIDSEITNL